MKISAGQDTPGHYTQKEGEMGYLLIKNGVLVDGNGERKADILLENSVISRIGSSIDPASVPGGGRVIDASGLMVLPGLIDAHTHFHLVSRGTVTADDFGPGSEVASHGGVTTVVDFADHNKGMNLVDSARYRLDEMKSMAIDYSLHQGVYGHGYNSEIPSQLEKLKEMGIKTLKIFTTYRETGYLLDDAQKLSDLFRNAKRLGMLVTAHCEYNPMIEEISANWKGTFTPKDHADLRPAEAEAKAIEFYGTCAMKEGCPLYIVHVSSKAGMDAIRKLRKQGAVIYAETTPTYLFLDRSKLEGPDGPLYVMTPALRTKEDNLALQEALMNGEIQVVATDHCTFTREQKLANPDVRRTYPGVPGIEEMVLLLNTLREKNPGRFSLKDIVNLISVNPAKIFGLYPQKGSLQEGTDADITLFDPNQRRVLEDSNVHTHALYTPYRGFEVYGKVCMTVLRGNVILENDVYSGREGQGRFIRQTT